MELARKKLAGQRNGRNRCRELPATVRMLCGQPQLTSTISWMSRPMAARPSLADEVARSIHPAITELHDHYHTLVEQFSAKTTLAASQSIAQMVQSIDAFERQITPALNPPEFLIDLVQQLNQSSLWDAVGEIDESVSWLSADPPAGRHRGGQSATQLAAADGSADQSRWRVE